MPEILDTSFYHHVADSARRLAEIKGEYLEKIQQAFAIKDEMAALKNKWKKEYACFTKSINELNEYEKDGHIEQVHVDNQHLLIQDIELEVKGKSVVS